MAGRTFDTREIHLSTSQQSNSFQAVTTDFIRRNFLHVSESADFLSVSASWLNDIVASDDVSVGRPASESEYFLFAALRRWVQHDEQSRKKELSQVVDLHPLKYF